MNPEYVEASLEGAGKLDSHDLVKSSTSRTRSPGNNGYNPRWTARLSDIMAGLHNQVTEQTVLQGVSGQMEQ